MGGGRPKENLLIILPFPEDKIITDKIRKKFPYIDIKYHRLTQTNLSFAADQGLPKDLFRDTTILVTFASFPTTPEDAPNLNLIHLLSAGIDHFVSHPLFTETDIPITTSSGIHGPTIAEWVLMSTLILSRNYKTLYELQKEHKWGKARQDFPEPDDWVGKRVGIAGYGSIGRQVARVFTSLGTQIYAYTARPRPTPSSRRLDKSYHLLPGLGDTEGTLPTAWYSGPTKADLHTFLAQDLDILVICLPLTPQTRAAFGPEEWEVLARRRPRRSQPPARLPGQTPCPPETTVATAERSRGPGPPRPLVINMSRGPIIDQPSLIAALKSHTLGGAALDVTEPEPLPPHSALWEMENVVVTPHVSGLNTRYLQRAMGGVLVENLGRRERGEGLLNEVSRGRGY